MNKKKVKILVSVASLVLVVAVMAVGVWAATSVTVSTTVKVGFTATGIQGNCKVWVEGSTNDAKVGNNAMATTSAGTEIASWDLTTSQNSTLSSELSFNFRDTDNDGIIKGDSTANPVVAAETVTLHFIFTNTSTDGVSYSITAINVGNTNTTYYTAVSSQAANTPITVAVGTPVTVDVVFTPTTNGSFPTGDNALTTAISFTLLSTTQVPVTP